MLNLPVIEIFSSIQGEGPYVGFRQIFLRLPNCNLSCPYCDTKTSMPPQLRIEINSGSQEFKLIDNPLSITGLVALLDVFNLSRHHSLSLTGGEPLLWTKELKELLPLLKEKGLRIYLETNGTLPENLLEIIGWIDIISMDIKLPYSGQNFWDVHEAFLTNSRLKEVFVKIVVTENTCYTDIQTARDIIARVDPKIQIVLQPVTPTHGINPPAAGQLLTMQNICLEKLDNVRVIPQTHVFMGQL